MAGIFLKDTGRKDVRLKAAFMLLAGLLAATGTSAADKTMIVLDASGSMWGQIGGRSKIEIARETLGTVLKSVPAGTELGLMVYGHREKGSCSDIELAVAPGAGTGEAITAFVSGLNPKGKTPLTQSVEQAADILKYTEDKATVVLVTDGLETCEADPCALASALEEKGVDFTTHVVGFGLTEEEGKQVACLAENTGGKYFQASDATQLVAALTETVAEAPMTKTEPVEEVAQAEPEPAVENNVETDAVLSEGGPSLGNDDRVRWDIYKAGSDGNKIGDPVDGGYDATFATTVEPGHYVAEARLGGLSQTVAFEAKQGETAKVSVNFNAGFLKVTPKRTAEDTAVDGEARIDVHQGEFADGGYGQANMFVPAGDLVLEGRIGPARVEETVSIKAGETVERTVLIGSGIVVAKAVYAEGGPAVDSSDIRFDIVATKAAIDGSRDSINGTYGTNNQIDTPAGDFVLTARLGSATGEAPFAVKAGERLDVAVNINAGVLAINAPGAYRIDIKEAKKDIQGKQKDVSGNYGVEFQDTLHPGEYIVTVQYEGDVAPKEATATVKAGERTEIKVD
jgi:Ca-activated chloride channel family protein